MLRAKLELELCQAQYLIRPPEAGTCRTRWNLNPDGHHQTCCKADTWVPRLHTNAHNLHTVGGGIALVAAGMINIMS